VCVYNHHSVPPGGARTKGFHEHGGSVVLVDQPPVSILDDLFNHLERSMDAFLHKRTDVHINLKQLNKPPAALL
jgi:hypothetical protein